jgi:hypothetical protein
MPLSGSTQVSQSRGFSGLVADVDAARGEVLRQPHPRLRRVRPDLRSLRVVARGVTSQARAIATSAEVKPPSSG